MKNKAHILIVEDEALLYKRMKTVLLREHFSVADYTPSVEEALENIQRQTPDLVLLDIDLQGEATGLDLGQILHNEYHIPFIYITDFADDHTFYKGLATHHEQFIVKTKPRLNPTEIIRAIHTVLNKQQETKNITKEGIIGLVDYAKQLHNYADKVTRVPIKYEDISFFTTDNFTNTEGKLEKLQANYLWLLRKDGKRFFINSSLKDLLKHLPYYFVQVSNSHIVNISPEILTGRINGIRLSVLDKEITISERFQKNFNKRMKMLYHTKA